MKRILLVLAAIAFMIAPASQAQAADPARGKMLFENPSLGGGSSGKSCLTCHEFGRDLTEESLAREKYEVMGIAMKSLPEVINFCIEVALRGEGIPAQGQEMEDLISYIQKLVRKKPSPDK